MTKNCFREFRFCFETLKARLPVEQGSDCLEASPKRVSDHPRTLIFRHRPKCCAHLCLVSNTYFSDFLPGFEELHKNGPRQTIPRTILLKMQL